MIVASKQTNRNLDDQKYERQKKKCVKSLPPIYNPDVPPHILSWPLGNSLTVFVVDDHSACRIQRLQLGPPRYLISKKLHIRLDIAIYIYPRPYLNTTQRKCHNTR